MFTGVVTSLRQKMTLFADDGRLLRARLTLSVKSYKAAEVQQRELKPSSPDRSHARVVREGELLLPELAAQWVQVSAVITGVETGGIAFTLAVEVNGWKIKAEIPKTEHVAERAAALMQRLVRIQGVAATVFNPDRQMTGRFLFVPSFDFITPLDEHGEGDFAPPLRATNELLRMDEPLGSKVRVRGVVMQLGKDGFYLRDECAGIRVIFVQPGMVNPGDLVEAEGIAALAPFRPVLRATRVSILNHGSPPRPVSLDFSGKLFPFHEKLVSVDADFLVRHEDPAQIVLQCKADQWIVEAVLPAQCVLPTQFALGDRLRLTGICELTTTHPTPRMQWVDGCRLQLASAASVRLLRHAPWWTLRRLMIVLGVVSAGAAGALMWVWMLRRTVKEQTETIAAKIKREGILEERQRIARELHDTVEQELTGLWLQLGTIARNLQNVPEKITNEFRFAQQMLRHCREEARKSIQDLRSIELERKGLAGAMDALLPPLATPGGATIQLEITGEAHPIGAMVESHLLRLAQEAVGNAIRHAEPRTVRVSLVYAPASVTLEVRDDGCGFDPAAPAPPGHFGLLGIRERAHKLQANLTIESAPGAGTLIRVLIPQTHEK